MIDGNNSWIIEILYTGIAEKIKGNKFTKEMKSIKLKVLRMLPLRAVIFFLVRAWAIS